jgi:glycosyltransferase involved in cell wall biosynthesis
LESQLKALISEEHVEWLVHVDEMASLLERSHVVCHPFYREELPKALIEACACSHAIVTTDVAGCRDVVSNGLNGILVKPRDAELLAVAIERLIRDLELRVEMGKRGRERAEKEFDDQLNIDKTVAVYESLL